MFRARVGVWVPVALSLVLASSVSAGVIVPINGTAPDGRTYSQLVANWWQWVLQFPSDINPINDSTGSSASLGQSGPVWFLAPSLGNDYVRTVTIPEDKYIFFPIVTTIAMNGPEENYTEAELRAQLNDFHSLTYELFAKLDYVQVPNIWEYRAASPVGGFQVTLPENHLYAEYGLPAGDHFPAVGDGWWLLLEPLSIGQHRLTFLGGVGDPDKDAQTQRVDYTINVPEPASLALLGIGAAIACASRRFRTIAR